MGWELKMDRKIIKTVYYYDDGTFEEIYNNDSDSNNSIINTVVSPDIEDSIIDPQLDWNERFL